MKALVLEKYNEFVYKDVPVPQIGDEEVLVRVKACAICGSDVHGMDGSTGRRIPPVIMGHEASGIIEKVGVNVKDYSIGDRVTFDSTIYCGKCYFCRRGEINLCDNRRVLGVSCGDYRQHGAMAEYISVPQHILYRIPDSVSFERAAMVEPLSVAFHAINNTKLMLNDTVVVVGAGMIGLLLIQLLNITGCSRIIAVDRDQSRLDMACRFGAYMGLKAGEADVVSQVLKLTQGRGADAAFEVVGVSPSFATAVDCVKKGGRLTLVGNVSPVVEMPLQKVVTREIKLKGSCASAGEYDACLDLLDRGKVNVDAFISAIVPLKDGGLWFKKLYDAEPGLMKVILKPDEL